jgi:peptidoglycan/xylan/chitin deacetylase (PgdA/CDA1 family)
MFQPVIFIRDDDVWTTDRGFLEIFEVFRAARVPVIYGVVPQRLDSDLVRLLKREKKRDIAQHGFSHEDHSGRGTDKYEFGPRRSFAQQYGDIVDGREIMVQRFGAYFMPAFIPPYHGFDDNTLAAVEKAGFPVFSAGEKVTIERKHFLDLPARVALNEYAQDGTPLPLSAKEMLRKAMVSISSAALTGMVFHHRVLRSLKDRIAMGVFVRSLGRWQDEGKVRIVLFSDMLRASGKRKLIVRNSQKRG